MALKIPELRFKIEGPILITYTSLCKNDKRFIIPESIDHYHFRQPCCVVCVSLKEERYRKLFIDRNFSKKILNVFKT